LAGDKTYDAAVAGAGPAGLAAALALAALGLDVALIAQRPRQSPEPRDQRTAALFTGSIELLRNLAVWPELSTVSAPITGIRLIDDRGALLRAPEVLFTAADMGLDAFGYNVPNEGLVRALRSSAERATGGVEAIETGAIERSLPESASVTLEMAGGVRIQARLLAAADGRHSVCRAAAGIATSTWDYPQSALACSFTHTRPHRGISTEFHRANGPFTVVPLPGLASSLVWVEARGEAERLAQLDEGAFRAAVEERLQGLLGSIGNIGPRAVFPLSGLTAERFGGRRTALVGEAAHVIPPIGAQGLNLGLRDAATLADCVADAMASGGDPGGEPVVNAYSSLRAPDIRQRIWTVDLLNRSLLSSLPPVHLVRGLGLQALKSIGPLRRLVVAEGLQPSFSTPDLMRPEGRAMLLARARRTKTPPRRSADA
jgi:2-octaprenyl-6-methoxyphenol hydroxylase